MPQPLFHPIKPLLSPCRAYQYRTGRRWNQALPRVNWLMLTPPSAIPDSPAPDLDQLMGLSLKLGFGSMVVTNLFSLLCAGPANLQNQPDPIGPGTNQAIGNSALGAGMVIGAWGALEGLDERGRQVEAILRALKLPLFALTLTPQGQPDLPIGDRPGDPQPLWHLRNHHTFCLGECR